MARRHQQELIIGLLLFCVIIDAVQSQGNLVRPLFANVNILKWTGHV